MLRCPHCEADGLRVFDKALSSAVGPARCQLCGGLSYPNEAFRIASAVLLEVGFYAAILAALALGSLWPFVVLLLAIPLAQVGFVVLPATKTDVPTTRRTRWLYGALALAFLVAGGLALFTSR